MQIAPFKLEQYFAKHEFTAKYMLSSSDCDGNFLSSRYSSKQPQRNLSSGITLHWAIQRGLEAHF